MKFLIILMRSIFRYRAIKRNKRNTLKTRQISLAKGNPGPHMCRPGGEVGGNG